MRTATTPTTRGAPSGKLSPLNAIGTEQSPSESARLSRCRKASGGSPMGPELVRLLKSHDLLGHDAQLMSSPE
jgi:hypothetical protein